jgi:polyisoprenoid-binding protein YceI|uniref:Polyisoprenoid-binding protein n=1 Tax=Desulfobacca acetoxidans TaxID=60893 RepID=A0A7C3Z369_9BACT
MAKWILESDHSSASFAVRHMMVTWVRGIFTKVSGTLVFDPLNVAASAVEVEIAAASLFTGVAKRDQHLKSADFLDTDKYPSITFKSTRVEPVALDHAWVYGDLTIRGVSRPVVLDAHWSGPAFFQDEGTLYTSYGFRGKTMINREDFGMTWNTAMAHGGVMVGRQVYLRVDSEADLVED